MIIAEKLESARVYIPNLHIVSERMVRGGQPEPEGLTALRDAGVRTIVNFCGGSSLARFFRSSPTATSCVETPEAAEERKLAEKLGLTFVAIPLDVFAEPPDRAVEEFIEVVDNADNAPTFVHCLHGRDRTGLMVAAYRVAVHGWTAEKAYAEMVECGFDTYRTNLSDALFAFAKRRGSQP